MLCTHALCGDVHTIWLYGKWLLKRMLRLFLRSDCECDASFYSCQPSSSHTSPLMLTKTSLYCTTRVLLLKRFVRPCRDPSVFSTTKACWLCRDPDQRPKLIQLAKTTPKAVSANIPTSQNNNKADPSMAKVVDPCTLSNHEHIRITHSDLGACWLLLYQGHHCTHTPSHQCPI